MSKGAQITVGATAIALLLAWYATANLGADASFQYYQTLEEFHAAGSKLAGQSLRVHGYVADASIERDLESRRVKFLVQNDPPHAGGSSGATLAVVYASLDTPDLFRDGAEVVVEGTLEGAGPNAVFHAANVLAKCPSKFEAQAGAAGVAEASL
jgi:cytochrome c-type biogenesis protein CcmE